MKGAMAVKLAVLLASSILVTACPSTPPTVTVTLPGANCAGTVACDVTAKIAPDVNLRPVMTIKVCVTCNGAALAGVGGITGTIQGEVPIPPNIPATTTFNPTSQNGCTTVQYVVPGSVLRGQQVTVKVVDTAGGTVKTATGTIE